MEDEKFKQSSLTEPYSDTNVIRWQTQPLPRNLVSVILANYGRNHWFDSGELAAIWQLLESDSTMKDQCFVKFGPSDCCALLALYVTTIKGESCFDGRWIESKSDWKNEITDKFQISLIKYYW